jgi:di/tricarboxylate transporter
LIQQVLVESAMLAAAACAVGLALANAAAPAIISLLASINDPLYLDLGINWRVAAFAGSLIVIATALFGLAPALHASRVAPMIGLKSSGDRMASGRSKAMRPFVMAQIAFGMIVLFRRRPADAVVRAPVASQSRLRIGRRPAADTRFIAQGRGRAATGGNIRSARIACAPCLASRPPGPPSSTCLARRGRKRSRRREHNMRASRQT